MTGEEFLSRLDYYAYAWLPARQLVQAALDKRTQVDASGKIILFEEFLPWKVRSPFTCQVLKRQLFFLLPQEHLFELEAQESISEDAKPLYVLYPDGNSGKWRIQAVPVTPDSFQSRKALPEAWRGLRDDQLSKVSGIAGGVFVHASGFIGGMPEYVLNTLPDMLI